jgi:hypothetical protein
MVVVETSGLSVLLVEIVKCSVAVPMTKLPSGKSTR